MTALLAGMILGGVLVACGPGPGGPGDGGDGGIAVNDTGATVAPPNIPWLAEGLPAIAPPILTPCPAGWHEVEEEAPEGGVGLVTCDPYGDTPGGAEPDACPDGSAHFVGDDGCTPVGALCPSGDFPEGLPPDATVIYVLSSAAPGGDGSEASPFATIADAQARAARGTVIAIGKGEYDEAVRLPPGLTLWGACAAETRLTASSWPFLAQGVITVPSADTHVRNLRIGPAELPGLVVSRPSASVSVDGVIIEGVRVVGAYAYDGGRIEGRGLVVVGTRANGTGRFGRGIAAEDAGTVNLAQVVASQNRDVGAFVGGEGSSLTLSGLVVRDTLAQESDGTGGRGLSVQSGATATVSQAWFSQNREFSIYANGDGTSLTLADVIVRDSQGHGGEGAGRGVNVQGGATATVSRALVVQNRHFGVFGSGAGTSLMLSDLVVADTQARESDGTGGRGLNVQAGAAGTVTRAVVRGNRELGVYASGEGTSLALEDAVVSGTRGQESDGTGGRGLNVQAGATVTVDRGAVLGNRELGVYASGAGTSLTLTDVVVRDTLAQESDGMGGRGLGAQAGAMVTATRAVLSLNRDLGAYATDLDTSLVFSDVVVHDTRARESDGGGGRGLAIQTGARLTATRAVLSRNRQIGVFAGGPGVAVELLDVLVVQTGDQGCSVASCADQTLGVGMVAVANASLSATRFEVHEADLCGVLVADNGQLDLSLGQVSGSRIGVCLQVDGYSVTRLTDGVRYVENGTNLDATSLPVPAPAAVVSDAL